MKHFCWLPVSVVLGAQGGRAGNTDTVIGFILDSYRCEAKVD